jgi:hypothetical protein
MDVATLTNQAQQLAGRVDTNWNERTLRFLNEGVERWAQKRPWNSLRKTLTMTADGTRKLVFPDYVLTIAWLTDLTNRDVVNFRESWDREATSQYLGNTTGAAYWWREDGVQPLYKELSAASTLQVRSEASDTYSVHITGLGQDTTQSGTAGENFFIEEVLSASGSGPNTSANTYKEILTIGRTARGNGDVLVTDGTTQLGRIAKNRWTTSYRRAELLRIPSAGTQLRCGVLVRPTPLVETNQVAHHTINPQYLIWYAAGLIHKAMDEQDLGEVCLARADRILDERDYQEEAFGDRDWGSLPDSEYWGSEDTLAWP